MKRNLINILLVVVVMVLLVLLGRYVRIAPVPTAVVVLKTSELPCGSWRKMTALLEEKKGVAAAEVNAKGRWAAVGYDAAVVTPQALEKTLLAAGYGSRIEAVMTPAQYKASCGHDIVSQRRKMSCCMEHDQKTEDCGGCCNTGR